MTHPFSGAATASFYVAEVTPGVTPTSPAWKPLRNTGGMPAVTRDTAASNELGNGREVSFIRVNNEQAGGEYSIELSQSSQDDLLAAALTSDWVAGTNTAGLSIAVNATAKTFTRATGDFTTLVTVGDLIQFKDLADGNAQPFIATTVTPLVITGAAIPDGVLTTASAATTALVVADSLGVGNLCKTVSILTWFSGKCGTVDAWIITRGVEFTGFSIELAVNAAVTGSFPMIGMSQEILTALPPGSTFPATFDSKAFASVDVAAYDGSAKLKLVDSFTISNDNGASAQFELGNRGVAFVERTTATNTFSMTGKLYDTAMIGKFHAETEVNPVALLLGPSGAMSFSLRKCTLTSATPEIGGPGSVTLSLEGQSTGTKTESSLTIQRITY